MSERKAHADEDTAGREAQVLCAVAVTSRTLGGLWVGPGPPVKHLCTTGDQHCLVQTFIFFQSIPT